MIKILTVTAVAVMATKLSCQSVGVKNTVDRNIFTNTGTKEQIDNSSDSKNRNDTVVIWKERAYGGYNTIYIEKNRTSESYKSLANFTWHNYGKTKPLTILEYIKKNITSTPTKCNTHGLPQDWLPLFSYKGAFYLYAPCDWGNVGRRVICDCALVYWYMDGPSPWLLDEIEKVNDRKYNLVHGSDTLLVVHILDKDTKMALWEFPREPAGNRYGIYIPKEAANKFDIVVNECKTSKVSEFIFDEINYVKILDDYK